MNSLEHVIKIYDSSSNFTIENITVTHDQFYSFCLEFQLFKRNLGEATNDIYWQPLISLISRYRFYLTAMPIPFNYLNDRFQFLTRAESLDKNLCNCNKIYPEYASGALSLTKKFIEILSLKDNPLYDGLKDYREHHTGGPIGVLLKEAKLIPIVETLFNNYQNSKEITLLVPSQLRGLDLYNQIVIIGFPRWFPEFVFDAPRSTELCILKYNWMKDNWKPKPAFIASLPGINYKSNKYLSQVDDEAVFTNHVDQDQQKVHINAEEILPTLNWSEISTRISSKKNAIVDFNDIENVDARLFLLENNLAVLLDSSEGSRATIINITDDIKTERINVDEIEIGMFILLRTQGGGEYILSIANQILGNKANYCREIQKHWKDLLRAYLRDHSTEYAISELRNLGSTRASKTNINNWLSYRSIKTEDFSDFNAIMRLINLKNESQEYWETMCMIDKAHLMAGQSIRKLLLRQIRQSNLNDLIQKDKIEFELPEAQGGSLTAFRITDIAPETITVPISRLQVLFEVDGL